MGSNPITSTKLLSFVKICIMFLTLVNKNGFPYASVSCTSDELKENIYNLEEWVTDKGYKYPQDIFISPDESWKNLPDLEYVGTNYLNGDPEAHIYREQDTGYYQAYLSNGRQILGSDKASIRQNILRERR